MQVNLHMLSLVLILSMLVLAAEAGEIEIKDVWAWESPPVVTNGSAYMILLNHGDEIDRLVGISGDVADLIELHAHIMEDGVMKMRRLDAVEVKPSEPTVFEPGGLHIMLIGLKQPLMAGETFPLTLEFEQRGKIPAEVTVRKLARKTMPEHGHED